MLNLSARQIFLHFIFLYFITLNSTVSTWIPCPAQHINKSTLYRALNGLHCTEAVVTQFAGDWAGSLSPNIGPRQLQSALVACEVLGVFQSRYHMQRCLACLLRPAYSHWQLTCTHVLCFRPYVLEWHWPHAHTLLLLVPKFHFVHNVLSFTRGW